MWLCWDWAYKIVYSWKDFILKEDWIIIFLLNNPIKLEKYTEINILEKLCFSNGNNFILFSDLILKDKLLIITNIILIAILIIIIFLVLKKIIKN